MRQIEKDKKELLAMINCIENESLINYINKFTKTAVKSHLSTNEKKLVMYAAHKASQPGCMIHEYNDTMRMLGEQNCSLIAFGAASQDFNDLMDAYDDILDEQFMLAIDAFNLGRIWQKRIERDSKKESYEEVESPDFGTSKMI